MTTTDPGTPALPLRRIQPVGSAASVTCYVKTQWPRIGWPYIRPLPDTAFTDPAFTERYRPGVWTYPYVACCGVDFERPDESSGLKSVADGLHMPIYKIASTESADPRRRLKYLNRMRYASHVLTPQGYRQEPGFKDWEFQQFLPDRDPLPGSPITLDGHLFALRRPHDLSKGAFEKLLHHRIRNASLNSFLLTPAGREHCDLLGLVPEQQQRWTKYKFGGTPRIDKAEELYIFRPDGEDSDRMLIILERLVFDWVMGLIPRRQDAWRNPGQYSRRR
ncbi:hypothetical protein [Bosea sp. (in: a-proteobacteria)]|uniref:hypothetical protein n=1 Tax=Bosea sp. (in: a-proteobacteria) TaxID=1871050 RepID=UPI001208C830|nr:hypothetical protein [Bosea sp. (in: a-proteobacteria)]TAJ33796.1 MAG: hypothetical protein EPO59_03990 [Bosea sp. (in: a-proteobacteria)]